MTFSKSGVTVPNWHADDTPSELADKIYNYSRELSQELGINVTTDASKKTTYCVLLGSNDTGQIIIILVIIIKYSIKNKKVLTAF